MLLDSDFYPTGSVEMTTKNTGSSDECIVSFYLPRFNGGHIEDKRVQASHKENEQSENSQAVDNEQNK
jgi:hypothetical protein